MTAMEHGAAVRVENCGKTFADGTRALETATLDIARGETLVLLGPSGCGKTTMLRIIAGLEVPDEGGKVLFDGKDMTKVPIERRNVGMVFQSYALFPNMSVADNIGYGLKIRGVPKDERAKRVLAVKAYDHWKEALGFKQAYWATASGYQMSQIFVELWAAHVTAPYPKRIDTATRPKDIAEVAVFLASPAAGYLTGQVLTVDGGLSLGAAAI